MEKRTYQSLQELPLMLSMMDVASVLGISKAGAYASMDRRERYLTDESDTPQNLSFERCVEDCVPFELLYENGCGSLEEDLERKEMLCILHKALQSIPAEEQEFIRELFFLHRTTRELAQKYGVSQPAIVKRKQRVLSVLKKYFENF